MIAISIVIPAHNEAESLPLLLAELAAVTKRLDRMVEVLIVDDGSDDHTAEVILESQREHDFLRLIRLDANYGQSAALEAGFQQARGDVIVMLDADGQNPPSEIPNLLEKLREYDMVCGWRRGRKDTLAKRLASRLANLLRRSVLADGVRDTGCSLKAFRREAIQRVKLVQGMHRFLPALVQMDGFSVIEIPVAHRPRRRGTSHYGILDRLLGPFSDLLGVYWLRRRCQAWRIKSPEVFELKIYTESVRQDAA